LISGVETCVSFIALVNCKSFMPLRCLSIQFLHPVHLCVTSHISHLTPHTSHLTPHTSHLTPLRRATLCLLGACPLWMP
jgi:hypothetical protein